MRSALLLLVLAVTSTKAGDSADAPVGDLVEHTQHLAGSRAHRIEYDLPQEFRPYAVVPQSRRIKYYWPRCVLHAHPSRLALMYNEQLEQLLR